MDIIHHFVYCTQALKFNSVPHQHHAIVCVTGMQSKREQLRETEAAEKKKRRGSCHIDTWGGGNPFSERPSGHCGSKTEQYPSEDFIFLFSQFSQSE